MDGKAGAEGEVEHSTDLCGIKSPKAGERDVAHSEGSHIQIVILYITLTSG
jgi:hypothetical protein